jgi:prefoldin alpha subunit
MPKSKRPEQGEAPHHGPHLVPHTDAEAKKDLQRKYMQFQMLRQYLVAITEERATVEAKLTELAVTAAALEKLGTIKGGQEMWSSLGGTCFVLSDIKDIEKVIVGIGANIFVKKPLAEAGKIIESRRSELSKINEEMIGEINALGEQLGRLEPEIARMAQAGK